LPTAPPCSPHLNKRAVDAKVESGKEFIMISKLFEINHSTVRKIMYKWHRFQMIDHLMKKFVSKSPKISSQGLQGRLVTLGVTVHVSTVRNRGTPVKSTRSPSRILEQTYSLPINKQKQETCLAQRHLMVKMFWFKVVLVPQGLGSIDSPTNPASYQRLRLNRTWTFQ
uniref:Transposase Tc1-like domain-containing protein n=1 Tax=Stegastes partitus TaxID=144197 RepID=A0A3B4ZYX4_9TELE